MPSTAFLREPARDAHPRRRAYMCPDRGAHLFFRHAHAAMQRRFVELIDPARMPVVFLHGNPHLANYAKNVRGAAMVDFDRARYGPFGYDVSRFLVSLSLRRRDEGDGALLHPAVVDSFRRGYLLGVAAPDRGIEQMRELAERTPKSWQRDLIRYLEKGKRWGKRLKEHAIDPTEPRLRRMLDSYLDQRGELRLSSRYHILAAAEVPGSLGKLHTLLLVASSSEEIEDRLLDFKEVYDEPDDRWFYNPFDHNGERMCAAGELHAPGWEFAPGWATGPDGTEYWVRGIPRHYEKLKKRLSPLQQVDLAFAVGTQLGRAHALSAIDVDPPTLRARFEAEYDDLVAVARQLRDEVVAAHERYLGGLAGPV